MKNIGVTVWPVCSIVSSNCVTANLQQQGIKRITSCKKDVCKELSSAVLSRTQHISQRTCSKQIVSGSRFSAGLLFSGAQRGGLAL